MTAVSTKRHRTKPLYLPFPEELLCQALIKESRGCHQMISLDGRNKVEQTLTQEFFQPLTSGVTQRPEVLGT